MAPLPLIASISAVAALMCAALTAGLFAAFSIAVMPALDREPATGAAAAMRRINQAIVRPAFLLPFFAGPAFAAVAALASPRAAAPFHWLAAALLLLGSVLPTMVANVPLNRRLDRPAAEKGLAWADFSARWTRWNDLRATAGFAAVAAIAVALSRAG